MNSNLEKEIKEFMNRLTTIESEMDTLRQDKRDLLDEFKSRLDVKAFKAALRIYKIKLQNNDSSHAIEEMLDVLEA